MNREEALQRNRKKRSWKKTLLFWAGFLFLVDIVVAVLFIRFGGEGAEVLGNLNYWLSIGVVDGILVIAYLLLYRIDAQNIALNENDLEDSGWLTTKKLRSLKEFTVAYWNEKSKLEDEIVIGAEETKKGLEIISTRQLHALIVGTTGSGKTTGYVDQNIEILSLSKNAPSLIITDPKKELYELHAKQLEARGYKISLLDLREPYASKRWNPMNVLIRRIQMIKEIDGHLENLGDGKYRAAGEVFLSLRDAEIRIQELKDEIFDNARDFVYTLCPITNERDQGWETGARDLIFALVLAFCEDCLKGKMKEEQLQLFNVYHNITKYCNADTSELSDYLLKGRDEYSKVRGLANTVLVTSDKTLTSYLTEVNKYMQQLSDDGMLSMTSDNELDIANMDEAPNAVFIVFPDERTTRHRFVTLFVTQVYKELVEKANLNSRRKMTETAILKRRVHFILDEFGQLPRFDTVKEMVSVARSRGIRFHFILQSFAQLNATYGADVASIIKDNCNVKIFIGTDDPDTRRAFSELCGNRKLKNFSVSTNVENPASSNTGATNQPLITPGELETLNGDEKGNAIISVRGYHPIWTKFTPSFELKKVYFPKGKASDGDRHSRLFDKDEIVFDITGETTKKSEAGPIEDLPRREEQELALVREEKKTLDTSWQKIKDEIERRVKDVCDTLDEKDAEDVIKAPLEDKANLLYILMQHYADSIAQNLRRTAEYLNNDALPQLRRLQMQAVK